MLKTGTFSLTAARQIYRFKLHSNKLLFVIVQTENFSFTYTVMEMITVKLNAAYHNIAYI